MARTRLLLIGIFLLLSLVSGCRSDSGPEQEPVSARVTARPGPAPGPAVIFEEPDLPNPLDATLEGVSRTDRKSGLPRVAIIIDDMGYHPDIGRKLLALDMALTFSFLPGAPFTPELEEAAWQKGADILVHMPMQARDPAWNPGPGALYLADSPEQLRQKVRRNLSRVPHAIGCNNHMGSRFTEHADSMRLVLEVLKKRRLFFIDSYTTARSTGMDQARALGVPTARRHVFLDNVHEQEKICRQLEELVALAEKKGWAIGIGHPNQATLTALTGCRDRLRARVRIVPVHELVRRESRDHGVAQ